MGATAKSPKPAVMFAPKLARAPLFFLHIPKTAGSSNNQFLRGIFGASTFQEHAENLLPELMTGESDPCIAQCVTGHIPLWAWHLYPGTAAFARITLLRDPWARLVSHINWVNLFNHGVSMPQHGPGAAPLHHMVQVIAQTDFSDRASLRYLFEQANAQAYFSSFDNYQVRMLRTGRTDAMEKVMERADLEVACDELAQFFHFGFCEDQQGFQSELAQKLGVATRPKQMRLNQGRLKAVSADNEVARQVFAPWIRYDQELFDFAQRLRAARV